MRILKTFAKQKAFPKKNWLYAKTREECEAELAKMIEKKKAEIAEMKKKAKKA